MRQTCWRIRNETRFLAFQSNSLRFGVSFAHTGCCVDRLSSWFSNNGQPLCESARLAGHGEKRRVDISGLGGIYISFVRDVK